MQYLPTRPKAKHILIGAKRYYCRPGRKQEHHGVEPNDDTNSSETLQLGRESNLIGLFECPKIEKILLLYCAIGDLHILVRLAGGTITGRRTGRCACSFAALGCIIVVLGATFTITSISYTTIVKILRS